MTLFSWDDFSGLSGVADTPLLLSPQAQQIILSAMNLLDNRENWDTMTDAEWVDAENAISKAFYQETEVQTMTQGTYYGIRARRSTNQNVGAPVSTWNSIVFDMFEESGADFTPLADTQAELVAPETGFYLIGFCVAWQANSNTDAFLRSSRILWNNSDVLSRVDSLVVSQQFGQAATTWYALNEGDTIELQCLTNVPNLNILAQTSYSPVLWLERVR